MSKRVLITADDGYNSVGVRTLAKLLKKKYSVSIAATLTQQSATGGKMNLRDPLVFGEDVVEGVPALQVNGSPVDTIEVAQGYFKKPFDLVVSGINFGENISYALISSGTFSAAVRAIGVQLAPIGIVMSWQTVSANFLRKHDHNDDLSDFIKYPGEMAVKVVEECLKNNNYNKELVNVNFPNQSTTKMKIVKPSKDITKLWSYPLVIDMEKRLALQPNKLYSSNPETDINTDIGALHAGYITICPLNFLGE